jgi:hypothetical protein
MVTSRISRPLRRSWLSGERPPGAGVLALILVALVLGGAAAVPGRARAAEVEPVIPCQGDACAPIPTPPEDPEPGTLLPGEGNPPPRYQKPRPPRPRQPHHHHKRHPTHKAPGKT